MKRLPKNTVTSPGQGKPGPPSGARPGRGAGRRASGGRAWIHGARPGQARKDYMESLPCGFTTCRESHWGWVRCKPGGRQKWGPGRADPQHRRLVLGTCNVTSLAGKEPELVREVEWYQLHMVGSPLRTAPVLEPNSWRGDGPSPFPELPRV